MGLGTLLYFTKQYHAAKSSLLHPWTWRVNGRSKPYWVSHSTANLRPLYLYYNYIVVSPNNVSALILSYHHVSGADCHTDGGGIRGYSALLILQELMKAIGRYEMTFNVGPTPVEKPAKSSYHPLEPTADMSPGTARVDTISKPPDPASSPWLPCHYFDYVAGTSTGG